MGVELDGQDAQPVPECVPCRPVHLRQRPEAERILERPRISVPERAAVEEGVEPGERLEHARVRAHVADRTVEKARVGRVRVEVERAGDVERVEQRCEVGDRERRERRRERVVVQKSERFPGLELEVPDQVAREIRVRREVGLAHRAQDPDARLRALVERVDDELRELRTSARRTLRKPVGEAQHRRAGNVLRCDLALADPVALDQQAVESPLVALDRELLAHADTGRKAVDVVLALERTLDDEPGGAHRLERHGIELDPSPFARDPDDLVERQAAPREHDHGVAHPTLTGLSLRPEKQPEIPTERPTVRQPTPAPRRQAALGASEDETAAHAACRSRSVA